VTIYGLGPIPPLGVAGSALGQRPGAVWAGWSSRWCCYEVVGALCMKLSQLVPDFDQLGRILNIGLPGGHGATVHALWLMTFTMTVAALAPNRLRASTGAAGRIHFVHAGLWLCAAATTLTGQGLGARDPQRARSDAQLAQRLAVLSMCIMGVVFFTFAPQIIGLFIQDPEVIALGVWPLRLVHFLSPCWRLRWCFRARCAEAGDTRSTLVITSGGLWLVRVPLALWLAPWLGLIGAWIAMGVDLNVRGLACWLRFRSGRWAQVKVLKFQISNVKGRRKQWPKSSLISLIGIFPPIPTPFKANEELDLNHLHSNLSVGTKSRSAVTS